MKKDITYLTNHYDEKIKKIKSYKAPLNFVFITDQHNRLNEYVRNLNSSEGEKTYELAVNAVESIQYILDRCPEINCVISGGDIGNDYAHTAKEMRASFKEIMDAMYSLSVPVYCCVGNHDDGLGFSSDYGLDNTEYAVLPQEMHDLCMKYNPSDENYYYIDFEDVGYRFVFMNVSDKPYFLNKDGQYAFGWRDEFSQKQVIWLEKEALSTDKNIIVFSHTPLHNEGIYGSCGSKTCKILPYDNILNGPRAYWAVKNCSNVKAIFAGHVHYDNLVYYDDLLSVTTLCSMAQQWDAICPDRICGTLSETAFDVVSIVDRNVFITRFGAGNDRVGYIMR